MRLEKFLSECGIGSRREIKDYIKNGDIRIDGKIIKDGSLKGNFQEVEVKFKDNLLSYKEDRFYLLHKVAGYITATEDKREKTVMELLPEWVNKKNLVPIGRLDKDTEGVLLFTNNGKILHKLISPKSNLEKKYYVELSEDINVEDINKLESGIDIGGYITKPAKGEFIDSKKIYLTITEGRFHQVKKMIKGVGNEVTYLKRVAFGKQTLEDLSKGEVVEVELKDII